MDDGVVSLASDFPAPDEAAWRRLVDKTLDGQPFEKKLVSRTYEGVKIAPLYTATDSAARLAESARAISASDPDRAWDLRVGIDHPDSTVANAQALADLDGGAASLMISIDPSGEAGVAIAGKADLERVLDGVLLDLAPVALDAGYLGVQAANWLAEIAEGRTLKPRLFLHMDTLSIFARTGASAGPIGAHLTAAGEAAHRISADGAFLASGQVVHEAGGGEAQELGFVAAAALAYARAAMEAGSDAESAFCGIVLGLAADEEYFSTLAKLRAARAIWGRITEAAIGHPLTARIEARSSRRMLSTLDPWVNMLRLTAAGFGAGVGGADAVVLDAFSQPLGRATPFARRQNRNTQLVLLEEARLGEVADPAGGSWYLESLTDQFARAGWAYMQTIEAQGGVVAALESGVIARDIAVVRAARTADIAKRKTGLIGVSEFADLASRAVDIEPVDPAQFRKHSPLAVMPGPDSRCEALTPWTSAASFERLRSRAKAFPSPPTVFLAVLGTPADYAARAGFARNLFAAGGMAAETGSPNDFNAGAALITVICSSDALYAESAIEAAKTLKAKGARRIYLAGRPGVLEPDLIAAGVGEFIYAGLDVIALLSGALTLLETQ